MVGENSSKITHEQPIVRVIIEGPTLAWESNRALKNCARYAMTNRDVLFNMLAAK